MIDSVITSRARVLITGESGTGKELCAEAIHKKSALRDKPFIVLNCGAFPKNLVETQLFGHVKGAFTGAVSNRRGAAEQANGGVLFLDEIGELDLASQAILLRFVQTMTFHPVGSDTLKKVDVRLICATNRDLLADIKTGRFRHDLYYRLDVFNIHLPPLRDREDDVFLLAQHFLSRYAENKSFVGFAPETLALFKRYDWPGNVRELKYLIYKIVLLNKGKYVTPDMLPVPLDDLSNVPEEVHEVAPIKKLSQVEKETILEAIEYCNGNVVQAANLLGIGKTTIYDRLRTWGITIKRTVQS